MTIRKILSAAFVLVIVLDSFAYGQERRDTVFDRSAFYHAMASSTIEPVNEQLKALKTIVLAGRDAFEGALTMKKAGLSASPDRKLNLFKSGYKKLESAIHNDTTNVEFRFLRLMIQEHAPGFLGYKKDLKKDSEYIRKHYKTQPQALQDRIIEYNKKSAVLKLGDS